MALKQSDSLFDNVNTQIIPDRELHVLNALDVSIHRCLFKYELVYQFILQNKSDTQEVVLLCWELVDWFERTRKILGSGSGIKKKDPAYILTFKALNKAKDFRNILQHFDSFVNESIESEFAPLGVVSAFRYMGLDDGRVTFEVKLYCVGLLKENINLSTVEVPDSFQDEVDYVSLEFNGEKVNLTHIARNLLVYYQHLRNEIAEKYSV